MSKTQAPDPAQAAVMAELLEIVRITIGNVRSLGPAGALAAVHTPYREWLAELEAVYAKASLLDSAQPSDQVATQATDDDGDLLTIAYMAGAHDARKAAIPAPEGAQAVMRQSLEALEKLLARDQGNTCTHENTHRGGAIWEFCDDCGARWSDDRNPKPRWKDPAEWTAAETAIVALRAALAAPAPQAPVALTQARAEEIAASVGIGPCLGLSMTRAVERAHDIPAPQTKEQP